jgi:sugar lactone lactonase YvrE
VPILTAVGVQTWDAELVAGPFADFGEGPLWDADRGQWWWTDIPGSVVHRFDPRTGEDTAIPVERTVGTLAPRASGGLVVAARGGFGSLAEDGRIELIAAVNDDDPGMRMNDGKCDSAGRFYAASMAFAATPGAGALLRLDPDGSVHEVESGVTIGNGLAWTADARTFYYVDTPCAGVDVFAVDPATGDLSDKRRLVDIDTSLGHPDGMCIDDEGALWVALWGGSAVHRYSPDGELLGTIELPVTNVTCPAFGGDGYDELYITTAAPRHSGSDANEPLGGALFRVRPGVTGPPPNPFRG